MKLPLENRVTFRKKKPCGCADCDCHKKKHQVYLPKRGWVPAHSNSPNIIGRFFSMTEGQGIHHAY